MQLELSPDFYGYVQYAVSATDDDGAEVATTLDVFVEPVNDAPTASQMPDRYHRLSGASEAPLVAIDLWYQYHLDGAARPYFWDAEDEVYLEYSVTVDDHSVFESAPTVDQHNFLLYRPTVEPGFQGSAVLTITAKDRDGAEARLPDGSRSTFTVYVDNSIPMVGAASDTSLADDTTDANMAEGTQLLITPEPWMPPPGIGTPLPSPLPAPWPSWPDPTMPPLVPPDGDQPPEMPDPLPPVEPPDDPIVPLPTPELPDPGLPDPSIPDPGLPDPGLPDPGVPDPSIPDPTVPDPSLPDPTVPDPTVPDPGVPDPVPPDPSDPPPPPGSVPDPTEPAPPGTDPVVIEFDFDALSNRVPEQCEYNPGVLVALNADYDEQNLVQETLYVGPGARAVRALVRTPDNQPDRIPEQGREHQIAASWVIDWFVDDDQLGWLTTLDDDLRPAIVTANQRGSVTFDVPNQTKVWVPAWALYGIHAATGIQASWSTGMRWIEVEAGAAYQLDFGPWNALLADTVAAVPVVIEGVQTGDGEITARFVPEGSYAPVDDGLLTHVVSVDLDVDSDNDDALQPPSRSSHEDEIENDTRVTGKRLLVNSDDADHDNIPDFLDGYDLDGQLSDVLDARPADDRVASDSVGFVPIVVELPAEVDPQRALLRFIYSASDPAAATIAADGSRHAAAGGLRLWTVNEAHTRRSQSVGDPVQAGHFVPPHSGAAGIVQLERVFSVAQLTGTTAAPVHPVSGRRANRAYWLKMEVDPDGIVDVEDGLGDDQFVAGGGPFVGCLLHDEVQVTVESEVTATAINLWGGEAGNDQQRDVASFKISRDPGNTKGELEVFYRLVFDAQHAYASDPVAGPSQADFEVWEGDHTEIGLADDPVTRIGSAVIPDGQSSVLLTIVPCDDNLVEWDELVSIELIEWDEYRRLHDATGQVTPNDGLPIRSSQWAWADVRWPYRLRTDAEGRPVDHVATVSLLDDDQAVSTTTEHPDIDSVPLTLDTISSGLLEVDLRDGQGTVALPVWAPEYREDDNLNPVAEVVLRLPEDTAAIASLSGVLTVGGVVGEQVTFDIAGLDDYLEENRNRDLRLVVRGPHDLSADLSTGLYEHDLCLTAHVGDKVVTRTIRGTTGIVNRVDDTLGTPEFGERWTVAELDRIALGDGISAGHGGQAASRLGPLGVRTESGIAVVRGDNSMTWLAAASDTGFRPENPPRVIGLEAIDAGAVRLSDALAWVGAGESAGHAYRTTAAGLHGEDVDVVWSFADLLPDHVYQVYVHWDAAADRASNALYEVSGRPVPGGASRIVVDQRYVPGELQWDDRAWRSSRLFHGAAGK